MMSEQTIELDCAPGTPRPGDLITGVITNLDLPVQEAVTKLFGNWVWDYSDIDSGHWAKIQPTLKKRITKLYNTGVIRYGSW